MAKVNLNDITSGFQSTNAANVNIQLIEQAFENTLSRDGSSPNQMEANLDMNGHLVINTANPVPVSGFTWEGPWTTTTVYSVGDIVEFNGTAYFCIVAHTAGVFATDLAAAKWQLFVTASLPSQTTHGGKFLQTDGASVSWQPPDAPEVTYTPPGTGAVATTVLERLKQRISVFDFMSAAQIADVRAGTLLQNVTTPIQNAIDYAYSLGGAVVDFPSGKYLVTSTLTLKEWVYLLGNGSANTEIYLGNASNCDILKTVRFDTLTLQNKWTVAEGVPTGFGFDKIKFNGNRANQTVAGGVKIYGKKYHLGYDVQIVSMKGVGFYSECAFKGGETVSEDQPEGYIGKLQVWESGQENIIYRGPHDQPIGDMYSALSGRDGVYDGVVFDGKTNVYQGITYVNGTVHSYASTGHGVVCKTQMMFNKLSGEHNEKSGVVFETTGATWIGAFYTNVNYLEGYGNDVNGTGLYWNFENRVLGTNIGLCRHSISFASAGSIYNTGHGLTIAAGVINCAGAQNGTAFKNSADFCNVDLKIYNANKVGDVGFESGAGNFCNYKIHLFGCTTLAWLNSGTTFYNKYHVEASQSAGTAFSQTGAFAGSDTFDVKLVVGGVPKLSHYNDAQRSIASGNTSVTVTHNAFKTPTAGEIHITPNMTWNSTITDAPTADTHSQPRALWVSNITATTFDVNTDVAAPIGGLSFYWKLDI